MNRATYLYVCLIAAGAVALAAVLPWSDLLEFSPGDIVGLLAFVGVAILSEILAIDFTIGQDRRAKSSIVFLPLFACAMVFPPSAAVAATVLVTATTELFLQERVLWRATFNISQNVLGIGIGALVYHAFATDEFQTLRVVVAFTLLTLAAFTVNILTVSGLFAIRNRERFVTVIRRIFGGGGGNLLYGLLASPVSMAGAILYRQFDVGGLLMLILPLMLIRYSYLSKVQLQQANRDLLTVLVKAIETRDPYTSGHSVRVSALARAIAEDLGLPRRMVERVEWAALLHDIGKIDTMYAPIIGKPSDLTEEERSIIRSHATKGAELLRTLSSLDEVVIQGVKHHHERYDGSGYPDGLAGKAIPIAARIIMLCDSIDAMLSDRPYRRALTIEQARVELLRCAGTQFDPDIVEVVLRCNTLERAAILTERDGGTREVEEAGSGRPVQMA